MKKYLFFILLLIQSLCFSRETYPSDVEEAKNYLAQQTALYGGSMGNASLTKKNPSILIFISFSMPEKSIEAYLRDAKRIHASVVIRGLIDNSFQKTFQAVAKLVKSSGGDGIELNPIWFKQFDIKTVPAVVILNENATCLQNNACKNGGDYDVMTGDIPLLAALQMIQEKGVTRHIPQMAIEKLQTGDYA